ncbi:hypothetical protein [Halococcus thailandensis]|uniref:Uncharacterized protein n=1 Tax=Halococcus thailandensis JCM 13552 TaxID=1227457 RepID=M0NHU5_9EURY|nr:hypothetical protein [Halococcus thailandensis]EMA56235.1 hypothetical protein C451_03434 [Halococcus thailandensis JCM 13552]
MVAQHTQDEDTTTENSRSDDSRLNSNNTNDDTEHTGSHSEHDIVEVRDAVVNELCDMTEGKSATHAVEPERVINVITTEDGVEREHVEEAIETALMEGYCYEPSISEETGDGLLYPICRPITDNESDQPADDEEVSDTTQEATDTEESDAPEESVAIDLSSLRSYFETASNTEDVTMETVVKNIESGILGDSNYSLEELEAAVHDSEWDGEFREPILSCIEAIVEQREANREFNRKVENGEIETNTEFPTPPEQEMQEGDGPPRPPVDPDAEPEPEWDDTDPILDEYHDQYQPEFPGQMSGESIHLEDDDMEWREPRSLY